MSLLRLLAAGAALTAGIGCVARAQAPEGGAPVLPADALLTTPVGGLERTKMNMLAGIHRRFDLLMQPD